MEASHTFVAAVNKEHESLLKNTFIQQLLMKWSMEDELRLQTFCYSEPFQSYQKQEFVNSLFQSKAFLSSHLRKGYDGWSPIGQEAATVEVEEIPCCFTTMAPFQCLTKPGNGIIRGNGWLIKCELEQINEFEIADNLRKALLDPESEYYDVVPTSLRKEFIFKLFQLFCLGGRLCQYEDNINVYTNITKDFYKDLIRVRKNPDTKELIIKSVVLKVVAKDEKGVAFFPANPENEQNVAYLIVDTIERNVTVLIHQYDI